ncbi:MAG: cysteine synthase family protein [Clostridiales Family XIII bacterium]|jgi:cysteine synthase B|nr:cysteine synthase family protein [Clostridiales Family XIII bacterium]
MGSVLDAIGNTPLIELVSIVRGRRDVKILCKAEFLNPSGSVKDRAAKAMILAGIEHGLLKHGMSIIDATSGNTGISYAMIGASLGYRVVLYMPANTSIERKKLIGYFGAEIVETDPLAGSDGAFLAVREAVRKNPKLWFYPDQYNNPGNSQAHYEGTGVEILAQTGGAVTHFVSVAGTSGTFSGTAQRLKEEKPDVYAVLVQPDSPFHGIEGTKHFDSTILPGIFYASLADETMEISTERAYEVTRMLAAEEGLFVGVSSGANVAAAMRLAQNVPAGSVIVTTLCDSGARYLSEHFWNPPESEGVFDWRI